MIVGCAPSYTIPRSAALSAARPRRPPTPRSLNKSYGSRFILLTLVNAHHSQVIGRRCHARNQLGDAVTRGRAAGLQEERAQGQTGC